MKNLLQCKPHSYRPTFFHVLALIVIVPAAVLFIIFSGTSAETDGMTNAIKATVGKEFAITLDANATTGYEWQANPPPSAHWSDKEPGWGEESQDE